MVVMTTMVVMGMMMVMAQAAIAVMMMMADPDHNLRNFNPIRGRFVGTRRIVSDEFGHCVWNGREQVGVR